MRRSDVIRMVLGHDLLPVKDLSDIILEYVGGLQGILSLTMEGHDDGIMALVTMPNRMLASTSADRAICIWDTSDGSCVLKVNHSLNFLTVDALVALPDGRFASSSLKDNKVCVWDPADRDRVMWLIDQGPISCLAMLPNHTLASASHRMVSVYHTSSGTLLHKLKGHTSFVTCLASLDDGKLASGSCDGTVRIWDVVGGVCLQTLKGSRQTVLALAALPDGKLASGSADRLIRVWDIASGACVRSITGHTRDVCALAVLPNGHLVSSSNDQTMRVWDPKTGDEVLKIPTSRYYVRHLAVLSDGRLATNLNHSVQVWE